MKLLERTVHLVMDLSDELEELSIESLYGEKLDYVGEDGERYRIFIANKPINRNMQKDPRAN